MNDPLVSIVMPNYNCADYMAETLDSVLAQSYKNWELYIMDDCSTDNISEIMQPYLDKYSNIHFQVLEKNGGPAIARTEGIKLAEGKYIAFLDSDDLWEKEKLGKQVNFMETNHFDFSCTTYSQVDEHGQSKGMAVVPPLKASYHKMLLLGDPIGNLTVMYNQESLGKFKVPNIKKRNDFALWLKILKDTKYCYGLQEDLAKYRIRSDSISRNKFSAARYHWKLYREIEKMNFFEAGFYVFCWMIVKLYKMNFKKK
ncbi:glycosyltransferase [Ligilactobacillus pobuzihii]|uniref:glycosyltransferase family 2 protein n=1 Tax=Ligilactobacillus pobuzihii TaxID=449659 RepID=UPI0019D30652|nr:glycosyltransferase family 2 protein [Ligilactobacillus pobuzihii]MBN7275416.1 glycosyltransferase [Ligilactobacillus pobuzihii]